MLLTLRDSAFHGRIIHASRIDAAAHDTRYAISDAALFAACLTPIDAAADTERCRRHDAMPRCYMRSPCRCAIIAMLMPPLRLPPLLPLI